MKAYMIMLLRIWLSGLRNFFRNAWLSTAATAIMVVTLTILLGSGALYKIFNDTIDLYAENLSLQVFLLDDIEKSDRDELKAALEEHQSVAGTEFISKDQALSIFQERNQDDPEVLQGITITDNVFPASFEVRLDDLSKIDEVAAIAEGERFEQVVDGTNIQESEISRKTVDRFTGAREFVTVASLTTGGLFAAISVLVIFNTIRMAVFTRSEEIEIMKLIGATPNYIRGPFLFEAAMYGLIAGILALVAVYSTLLVLGPQIASQIEVDPAIDVFVDYWYLIGFSTLGAGVLVGLFSSGLAIRKYLRLKRW